MPAGGPMGKGPLRRNDAGGARGLVFAALLGQGGAVGRMSPQRAGEQA